MALEQFRTTRVIYSRSDDRIYDRFFVKQGDRLGRILELQITNGGVVSSTSGISVFFVWQNKSNKELKSIESMKVVDIAKGLYSVDLPDMGAGQVEAYFKIMEGDKVIGLATLPIESERQLFDESEVGQSPKEKTVLDSILQTVVSTSVGNYPDLVDKVEYEIADVSIMSATLGKLGDYYDPATGKLVSTPATTTFKPTGKINVADISSFFSKGISSWVFYKTDGTYINGREMGSVEVPVNTVVTVPLNTGYMIGNVKDSYFYADDPQKSQYWIESASAKASKMTYQYNINGLIVEENNLSADVKELIGGGAGSKYRDKTIVNLGDSIIENKNPSVSDYIASELGATVINGGFGGCMMCPHPNAEYAKFSMTAIADAIVSGNWSLQENATGVPASFKATVARLKAVGWYTVYAITISYGTNDWLNSNVLDDTSDSFNKATYLGASRYSIRAILQKYPHIKILVTSPIFRSTNDRTENSDNWKNGNNVYMREFADGLNVAGKEIKIPIADTFYGLGINQWNESYYFPASDGTHLNAFGRDLLGTKIANEIKRHY